MRHLNVSTLPLSELATAATAGIQGVDRSDYYSDVENSNLTFGGAEHTLVPPVDYISAMGMRHQDLLGAERTAEVVRLVNTVQFVDLSQ
jgi:hypothetical protein